MCGSTQGEKEPLLAASGTLATVYCGIEIENIIIFIIRPVIRPYKWDQIIRRLKIDSDT